MGIACAVELFYLLIKGLYMPLCCRKSILKDEFVIWAKPDLFLNSEFGKEPWLDFCPDDCEGFGQNSDYFREYFLFNWEATTYVALHSIGEDISKKIVKRVPLSNTGASRNIFTLPRDSKYKVDSSGKTYKGDDIALKFVDLSKRNAACEVVSLQYFEYFIDAGIVKDDPGTGVIVMKKQPGKPLHKIKAWQEAPLKQKLAIYHKVQSTVCSKIYDWIQRRELLYSYV
ncbi:hypothetical protein HHX47_DHR7000378 [Lentinula edodes]|nr:hypothetical protein HHX47_DHR7000378 [Lentinula edodes]